VLALQAETPRSLQARVPALDESEARRVVAAVHRDESIHAPIRGVRRASLEALRPVAEVPALERITEQKSLLDPFRKLLLAGSDGRAFETVRIPLEKAGRFSVCVSSQVGCALACAFCATGRLGLLRNLETWEIVEQVREVRRTLKEGERVHGVVFQGMGEPLANLDRVLAAIDVLTDPCAQPVDARAITVCTSGLPTGILRLAREAPRVRLGVSIGSAIPGDRAALMPIDKAHPLDEVLEAAVVHARASGYAPMWALTLLEGRNDSAEHARALAERAKRFEAAAGVRPRISIIPYNSIGVDGSAEGGTSRSLLRDPFARSTAHDAFRDELARAGVFSHARYSGGSDIAAACGQLRAAQQ
jgi:23S rRNA (adenine2503-C2)-methyltransferase